MKKLFYFLAIVLIFILDGGEHGLYAADIEKEKIDPVLIEIKKREVDIKEKQLDFDREKWEWEKSEKVREEYEKQFSDKCDFRRPIPVLELVFHSYGGSAGEKLRKDLTILKEAGHKKVILNVFSGGGSGFVGMAMSDIITDFVRQGIDIEGRAYGVVASAAVPVYAACSKRISQPSTLFMVHEAAIWEWKFGVSQTTHSDIKAQKKMMDKMQDRYLGALVKHTKKDREFWEKLEGETTWFTAEEAREWGLVDEIK